ncbi:MAG: T9SS type A sorting domain-containing protein [Bacteroidota bacterium]
MKRPIIALVASLWLSLATFAQPAPDFTVTASDGTSHSLYADYLNQGKTVMIEIFFVACPPCRVHAPFLEELYQDWGAGSGDVEFIALSSMGGDSNADVAQYKQTQGLSFPGVGQDGGALIALQPYLGGTYGPFFGTPTFIVISPDGTVNYDVSGGGVQGNIDALDVAIAATGAQRPGQIVDYSVSGNVRRNGGNAISGVRLVFNDAATPFITDGTGDFEFTEIAEGTSAVLEPTKNNNHRNGVTTFDIVLAQRHILQIDTLDSPYKIIAADINRSNSVTTFDVVLLRRLVLQIDSVFGQNTSWRFIPSDHVFTNPVNPFNANFPESITVSSLDQDLAGQDFRGLKVGDLNNSADVLALAGGQARADQRLDLYAKDQRLLPGEEYVVEIKAGDFEDIIALQSTVQFDPNILEFVDLPLELRHPSLDLREEHFYTDKGAEGWLTLSWNALTGLAIDAEETLFALRFKALASGQLSEMLQLNSTKTPAVAYSTEGYEFPTQLQFQTPPSASPSLAIYPNPNRGEEIFLNYDLQEAATVQVALYSLLGQHVQTFNLGFQGKGRLNSILPTKNLASGIYIVSLSIDNQQVSNQKLFYSN